MRPIEAKSLTVPRVVVVTGGGAGMGLAFAHRFAQAGHHVAIIDVDSEAADKAVQAISGYEGQALSISGDVADEVSVTRAFDMVFERWGRVDVLINNAGIASNVPTSDLTLEAWRRTLDINQTSVFLCSRELARRHIDGEAVIINISSMYGEVAAPHRLAYCGTKSAVAMMTRVLAIEWADQGIRVNAVAPGYIDTPFLQKLVRDERVDLARIRSRTPLSRLGTPEEIADLVFFIASPENRYMTGQVVTSDGGWSAYGHL